MNNDGASRTVFQRDLAAHERATYMAPNANVVMVASIQGIITKGALCNAVTKARQKHPLLGVRIILENTGKAQFISENVPQNPVRVLPLADSEDWRQCVAEEIRTAFPLQTGPLVRFRLLPKGEQTTLIVTAHHTVCDGLSLAYLIHDLLVFLNDPTCVMAPPTSVGGVTEENIPGTVRLGLLEKLMMNLINRKWRRKSITFSMDDIRTLHTIFWQRDQNIDAKAQNINHHHAWALTREQTRDLVARCRKEQVTLNTALVSAFLAARSEITGNPPPYPQQVIVSVNLRDRLTHPVGDAFGHYASAVRPNLDDIALGTGAFWDEARKIHARIRTMLTDDDVFALQRLAMLPAGLLDAFWFAKCGVLDDTLVTKLMQKTGKDRVSTPLLTANLGRFSLPTNHAEPQLKALWGPFVLSDTTELYLGAITVNGALRFAASFTETAINPSFARDIIKGAMTQFGQAIDSPIDVQPEVTGQ